MRLNIWLAIALSGCMTTSAVAQQAAPAPRTIQLDLATAGEPVDRFYDLSIGSDFPGTLIRSDSQAQLVPAVQELGFRYIRFHDVFHDVLGTVKDVDGTLF